MDLQSVNGLCVMMLEGITRYTVDRFDPFCQQVVNNF